MLPHERVCKSQSKAVQMQYANCNTILVARFDAGYTGDDKVKQGHTRRVLCVPWQWQQPRLSQAVGCPAAPQVGDLPAGLQWHLVPGHQAHPEHPKPAHEIDVSLK